jgi:septum formation protein
MSCDVVYLGSQSQSRQALLREAGFVFEMLGHMSNEDIERGTLSFSEYVMKIAQHKMANVILPTPSEKTRDYLFVVTADTLVRVPQQNSEFGKPKNLDDAKRMLRFIRQEPVEVVTGCCIEKKVLVNGMWVTDQTVSWSQTAVVEFIVEDRWFDWYFEHMPQALHSSGAGIIEGFGQIFFKSISGSHSAVCGLPLFQVRQALEQFGFRF